jgi:hypothetical protein
LTPALRASQVDITETIKTAGQRSTSGFWTRLRVIIDGEVALTLVLLVGAELLLRSVYKLSMANPGFDPAHIVTVQISRTNPRARSAKPASLFMIGFYSVPERFRCRHDGSSGMESHTNRSLEITAIGMTSGASRNPGVLLA